MVALVGDALRSNKRQATIPSARFRRSAFSSCESTAALEHKVKAFYQPRPMQTAFSKLDTGKLGTSNQRMPGRWVVFLSQNHLQLQALLLSSVA